MAGKNLTKYESTHDVPIRPKRVWINQLLGNPTALGRQWIHDCNRYELGYFQALRKDLEDKK